MDNKVYIFDKNKSTYQDEEVYYGHCLGEVQANFNFSFVIDGTKDSAKVSVISFTTPNRIEPWTILWHKDTDTWWIVDNDKLEVRLNDSGFVYIHNLQLIGAIELLNARDLTDCGFNQNKYTLGQAINRLFDLSNFYLDFEIDQESDINVWRITLDHIKTFENYTLLSALRELLAEYNCVPTLDFYEYEYAEGEYFIDSARINILSKSGRNWTPISVNEFNNTVNNNVEVQTIGKDSFGTIVVSNADNVISTLSKTYPSVGAVRLSSEEWDITTKNAILRLPSPAFKVNWVAFMPAKANLTFVARIYNTNYGSLIQSMFNRLANPSILGSIRTALISVYDYIYDALGSAGLTDEQEQFNDEFYNHIDEFADTIKKGLTTRLFQDNVINANTGKVEKGANVPYLAEIDISDGNYTYRPCTVADKETANMLQYQNQAIYWERGSRIIQGFGGISSHPNIFSTDLISAKDGLSTDLQQNISTIVSMNNGVANTFAFSMSFDGHTYNFRDSQWVVNYIPMSDIKIKIDNQNDRRDIQLYNQNGKLTDSVALSKLLYSYSTEISSANITRYKNYRDWDFVPRVGQIVLKDNDEYVINNVSCDFHQNDNEEYFIECEITMSKNVATKSILTNPNTNIRDYGIPQKYNIKRKQVYRDYYELGYTFEQGGNTETPYYSPLNIFKFGNTPVSDQNDFICQIKLHYDHSFGGDDTVDPPTYPQDNYFYQLETTAYILDKSKYIVCDFQDNNIIGYGFMNAYGGFNVAKLFDPTVSVNTPISYVDENGNFEGIDLLFLTPDKLQENIETYKVAVNRATSNVSIYNASVFIDETLFAIAQSNHDIEIKDDSYNKDALEVPVFEYAIQVENNDDVKIGSAILRQQDDCVYVYGFVVGENINEYNAFDDKNINDQTYYINLENGCKITPIHNSGNDNSLLINIYNGVIYQLTTGEYTGFTPQDFQANKDYAFFRYSFNTITRETTKELLFVAKKVPTANISLDGKTLTLCINHWKLK